MTATTLPGDVERAFDEIESRTAELIRAIESGEADSVLAAVDRRARAVQGLEQLLQELRGGFSPAQRASLADRAEAIARRATEAQTLLARCMSNLRDAVEALRRGADPGGAYDGVVSPALTLDRSS